MVDNDEKKVMIQEIVDFFGLEQLTGNADALNRWVVIPDVNRPGLSFPVISNRPNRVVW